MEALSEHIGIPLVLDRADIDTDQIIPKQFLKKIDRTGFGVHLFHDMRYLDVEGVVDNPNFVLNQPRYRGASILISGRNFGSGSSREHAPWALHEYGFRCLIASSFADIFYNNCFKNGILPIVLDESIIDDLKKKVLKHEAEKMRIDLPGQKLYFLNIDLHFEIDEFRKNCLLNGWDDIALTLQKFDIIKDFIKVYSDNYPYLFSFRKK